MYQLFAVSVLLFTLTGCVNNNTESDKKSDSTNDSKDNNFTIIRGTVPGTLIEAICDDNKYFSTNSIHNDTDQHPFELQIESNLQCRLLMTTNEGTDNNIITNIAIKENNITSDEFQGIAHNINIGHVALALDKSQILDEDNNSIIDDAIVLSVAQYADTVLDVDGNISEVVTNYPLYDDNTTYVYLDRATFNGENFEAKEWNIGRSPDYTQTGAWKPLSFSSDRDSYAAYVDNTQYHYPNRVLYFDVVYEAKYDTLESVPTDLNSSHWNRLGELK